MSDDNLIYLRELADSVIETSGDGKLLRWAVTRIEELEAAIKRTIGDIELASTGADIAIIQERLRRLLGEDNDNE